MLSKNVVYTRVRLKLKRLSLFSKITKKSRPYYLRISLNMKEEVVGSLNHQLTYLLRAHSANNNINDRLSYVTDAAFELKFDETDSSRLFFTNLCATCGQNLLNIIDTNSGQIVKRFRDTTILNGYIEVIISSIHSSSSSLTLIIS